MRLQEPLRAGSRWREEPVLRPVDESDLAEYVTPDVTMIGNVVASARTVRLTLTIATRGQAAAALARTGSLPFVLSPLPAPLPPNPAPSSLLPPLSLIEHGLIHSHRCPRSSPSSAPTTTTTTTTITARGRVTAFPPVSLGELCHSTSF